MGYKNSKMKRKHFPCSLWYIIIIIIIIIIGK